MKQKKILFSIITPVLNDTKIKNVFKCLNKQTYRNFEHIVVDGGSRNNTKKILIKNKKYISKLITENDEGIYDAINKGIKKSKGEIIGILNADDIYFKDTLKIVNKYFSNKKIDYLFGSVIKERLMHGFWPNKIWYKFNIYPSHSCGFFVKKKVHKKLGLYDLRFKYSSDRDFIYRLILSKYRGTCAKKSEIFGKFNPYGISWQISYFKRIFEEFRIRIKNQNFFIVIFVFFITMFHKLYTLMIKYFK